MPLLYFIIFSENTVPAAGKNLEMFKKKKKKKSLIQVWTLYFVVLILSNIKWVEMKCRSSCYNLYEWSWCAFQLKHNRCWPYMYVIIQRFPKKFCVCVKPWEEGEKNHLYMTVLPMVPHPVVLSTPLSLWISHTSLFIQIQHSPPHNILLVFYLSNTGKDFFFFYSVLFKAFTVMSCVVLAWH